MDDTIKFRINLKSYALHDFVKRDGHTKLNIVPEEVVHNPLTREPGLAVDNHRNHRYK